MGVQKNHKPEARSWLRNNGHPSALASNRFGETEKALEFVKALYAAGAVEVTVDNIKADEWELKEGGPYADSLVVRLPADSAQRAQLFRIFEQEAIHEGFEPEVDSGQDSVMLWWD